MNEQVIQHVSDTAFWVAYFRSLEGQRQRPLFSDPLAGKLAGDRGRRIAQHMGRQRLMRWTMAMRTHVIDEMLRELIQDGADTVVNLGAGLDTRPYRLELARRVRWIEVDFPAVISWKDEALRGELPLFPIERISLDLSQADPRRQLFRDIHDRSKRTLVLTEGVIPYLSAEETAALARDLQEHAHFQFWITDYYSRRFFQIRQNGLKSKMSPQAAFRFNPEDWNAFFRDQGWVLQQMHYLADVGESLKRPMPLPIIAKIMGLFMKPQVRQAIRELSGFALLKRAE